MEQINFAPTFAAWQQAARRALQADVHPSDIHWQEGDDVQPVLGMFGQFTLGAAELVQD